MSSLPPADTRARPRYALIGLALVLTFLSGLAVAAWAGRRFGWFAPPATPVAAAQLPAAPAQPPPPASQADLAVLTAREAALSAQLAALEARLPVIAADVTQAGAQAGRAEAVLVAGAVRRALDRRAPLGRLEEQLRLRFPNDTATVETIAQAAREPVTLEDLRLGFDAIAPELQTGARAGFLPALRRELGALIVLRRAGSPSPLPAERVARARRLLDSGQVEAALAETQTLPGAARSSNWTAAARRYVAARRALDSLEEAALVVPAVQAPVGGMPGSAPATM